MIKKRNKRIKLVVIVIALTVISSLLIGYLIYKKIETPKLTDKNGVVVYSTDKPDERKIDNSFKWQGQPKDPKKIIIPKINVDAHIQKVGIDQNKEVAVPTSLYTVGWFVDTVRPGEKGLSLIDGHVTGRQNDGVFKDLNKLKKGDQYSVERGDGTVIKYEVIGKESAKIKESVGIMFSQDPSIARQLNLVTCAGQYDKSTRTYNERLTVMSKRIDT